MLNSCINNILFRLFPTPCLLCDQLLSDGSRLCPDCESGLPYLTGGCQRCGVALPAQSETAASVCGQCLTQAPDFDRCISLFHYEKPVDYWLQQLKFQRRLHIAPLLSELLWRRHKAELQSLRAQWVIPLPLHRRRLAKRGFNQAVELGRELSKRMNLYFPLNALQRVRATAEQSSLAAHQRAGNVKDAFAWRHKNVPQRVILVDDIMTTGHTANSASRCLRKTGVKEITVLVFARAT